jgi:hypothetical protein
MPGLTMFKFEFYHWMLFLSFFDLTLALSSRSGNAPLLPWEKGPGVEVCLF